jgi:hypothetical protein
MRQHAIVCVDVERDQSAHRGDAVERRGWLRAVPTVVVSVDVADLTALQLREEVLNLRNLTKVCLANATRDLTMSQRSSFQ